MSARLKIKIVILLIISIAGCLFMCVEVSTMQNNLSLTSYEQEMEQELSELPELLQQAQDESASSTQNFDDIYFSKAQSVAFMAQHNAGFDATNAKMQELASKLQVDNLMIVSRSGQVQAKTHETKADFASSRFNRLRACLDGTQPTEAVKIELEEEDWYARYYAAAIDNNTMVVIEQSPDELNQLINSFGSTSSVLKNITLGQSGFVFALSAKDYLISYYPNDSFVGLDALQLGIDATVLEDKNLTWINIAGQELYCEVAHIDDSYYIAAIPESDIASTKNITTGIILFVFFVVMLLVVFYGICVLHDEECRGTLDHDYVPAGFLRMNKKLARKGAVLLLVGFVGIVAIAFYMQSLFALSSEAVQNTSRATNLASTMQVASEKEKSLREQYKTRYLDKCRVGAYMLEHNSSLANDADLQKIADVLHVQYVDIFDSTGTMTFTNSPYTNYALSDNPSDPSYEFRKLLQGVDSIVQDARTDEISGELRQYIGVTLHDANGHASGFLQINVRPQRLTELLENVQVDKVLDGVKIGSNGFAFAINKNDNTFAYFPNSKLQGKNALDCGMAENQLKDGFCDYITINGTTYYTSAKEQGNYYLYVAGERDEIMADRGPLTLVTAKVSAVCLLLIFLILMFESKNARLGLRKNEKREDARIFTKHMPDGRTVRTESVQSRWLAGALKWREKTPEQKVAQLIRLLVGACVLVVCLAVLFQDSLFSSDSLFAYVLGGGWQRGLNIFAVTASIMFACVAMTAATLIKRLLLLLASTLDTRGETVCRLLGSFIKYATIIGMVYYCLALLGVDTTTLLASAGILSIAISLGAKELVSDILSGLFIIFEGDFRVGDIIEVGKWSGTVVEIGVRTTKVMNGSQNIKVIRNSNVSDIVNMTKKTSSTWIDIGIEYSESLERVENILAEELPKMKESIPGIISGPFYKGVVALGDSSVDIRIMAQCLEKNRSQVERDLNRAVKLLFDHYDIGIPFPQLVVNEPIEKKTATLSERDAADKFAREQREASQDMEAEEKSKE